MFNRCNQTLVSLWCNTLEVHQLTSWELRMAKTATITTRVDPELKANIEEILSQLGMNTTQAINMFLKQLECHQGFPFDVQLTSVPDKSKQRLSGLHQDAMKTSDDFDAPLDDANKVVTP